MFSAKYYDLLNHVTLISSAYHMWVNKLPSAAGLIGQPNFSSERTLFSTSSNFNNCFN